MLSSPDARTLLVLGTAMVVAAAVGIGVVYGSARVAGSDARLRPLVRGWIGLVALTWFLLIFGASVRVNAAGLACPDWPLCFGKVIPEHDWKVFLEFWHRVVAGVVSLGFLGLSGWLLSDAGRRPRFVWGVVLAGVALAVQIVLGGLTVLHLLAEWTVASHLLGGNTFCLMLALVTLRLVDHASPTERAPVSWGPRLFALVLGAAVVAQVVLGGLVSSSHAGLACGTWPTCDGHSWYPTWAGAVGLQLAHRSVAYALIGLSLVAAVWFRGRPGWVARGLLVIILGQAALGVANVLLHLPVEVTLLHTAGAALSFLGMGWLNYEVWSAPLAARQRVASPQSSTASTLRAEGV